MIDISKLKLDKNSKVLIIGGDQINLITQVIESLVKCYDADFSKGLEYVLSYNLWIYERHETIHKKLLSQIDKKWGLPESHNIHNFDFIVADIRIEFDYALGHLEDRDLSGHEWYKDFHKLFGRRLNQKVHPNRYSYSIIKSKDLLSSWGECYFVVSNSLRLSRQMKGLRKILIQSCSIEIVEMNNLDLIHLSRFGISNKIIINGTEINIQQIELSPAEKWITTQDFSDLFHGTTIGEFGISFPGFKIEKTNFIKKLEGDMILENSEWRFQEVQEFTKRGDIKLKKIAIEEKIDELRVPFKAGGYRYLNTHTEKYLWSNPTQAIMWRHDVEELISPEENWGLRFYEKCVGRSGGLTWNLNVKDGEIHTRFLIGEFFSESSAPLFILKWDVDFEELFFILGWLCSSKMSKFISSIFAGRVLSDEDFLKLPYPSWVESEGRLFVIELIQHHIQLSMMDIDYDYQELKSKLDEIF